MERITISLDAELAAEFDRLIGERGYKNRSEAMRDMLRAHLEQARRQRGEASHCVANLSYVYNHHERDLADYSARILRLHDGLLVDDQLTMNRQRAARPDAHLVSVGAP